MRERAITLRRRDRLDGLRVWHSAKGVRASRLFYLSLWASPNLVVRAMDEAVRFRRGCIFFATNLFKRCKSGTSDTLLAAITPAPTRTT